MARRNTEIPFSLQTAFNNRKYITRRIRPTVYASPNSVSALVVAANSTLPLPPLATGRVASVGHWVTRANELRD